MMWLVCCWVGGECNSQPSMVRQKQLILGKGATGQRLLMVSKKGWWPSSKGVNDITTTGADKFGWQTLQQARGDNTTTNHRQECQRHSDVDRGFSNSDIRGKGATTTFVNISCCQRRRRWDGADCAYGSVVDGKGS